MWTDLVIIVSKWVFQILFIRMFSFTVQWIARGIIRLSFLALMVIFVIFVIQNKQVSVNYIGFMVLASVLTILLELAKLRKMIKR